MPPNRAAGARPVGDGGLGRGANAGTHLPQAASRGRGPTPGRRAAWRGPGPGPPRAAGASATAPVAKAWTALCSTSTTSSLRGQVEGGGADSGGVLGDLVVGEAHDGELRRGERSAQSGLRRRRAPAPAHAWAGFFPGLGIFPLLDGIVDHKLLRLHQVPYGVDVTPYDGMRNLGGLVLLLIGAVPAVRASRRGGTGAGGTHAAPQPGRGVVVILAHVHPGTVAGPGPGPAELATAAAALPAAAGHCPAAARLRRRGDAGPRWWDASFTAGRAGLAWAATSSPPGGPFTAHMAQHLVIGMAAPVLCVLARPPTPVLRSLAPRCRASWAAGHRAFPCRGPAGHSADGGAAGRRGCCSAPGCSPRCRTSRGCTPWSTRRPDRRAAVHLRRPPAGPGAPPLEPDRARDEPAPRRGRARRAGQVLVRGGTARHRLRPRRPGHVLRR
ncbi:DUF2243 domain-containing protein [Streptomyces sp. NPDC003697]